MKSVILIYTTDSHHSMSSMELIAIASTEKKRDSLVRKYLKKNYLYEKPSKKEIDEAIEQIQQIGQTQGLSESADIEIYTETYDVNVLSVL